MQQAHHMSGSGQKNDLQSCRMIEMICFAVLWPVALIARLTGWRWRPWPPGPKGYTSAFGEARTIAGIIAGTVISL